MKNTNEKKITELKVHKVVIILHTIALLALLGVTVYDAFLKHETGLNPALLISNLAVYCGSIALYEETKKKEEKKEQEAKEKME